MHIFDQLLTLPLSQPVAIFLLVLLIILFAPLIFRALKIPNIVGLILAGVAVGPYGFNLLAYDSSFQIFGQVGILYLMFLAAVEIDMYHLRRNIGPGLVFGLLTCMIPMATGALAMRGIFGVSWLTAMLVAVMFASHTLVSYPIISRFGLSNNKGAVISVCGTIVAVLLALICLAEVIDIRQSGSFSWGSLVKLGLLTVIYAVAVGYLFPYLTRIFFRKIADSVSQFIYLLAMVFVASLLASLIGLEAILGAFYAGLVLNRFVPSRSALKARLEFVGNAIFIPYFLIGVGMLINVHVLFRGWGVMEMAAVMSVTALATKWVPAWITQLVYRLGRDERMLMFGLSSGKAAATIAATMIGFQYGLLSEDMMNGAVVMILVCCIVAPVVTEKAARRIRIKETSRIIDEEGREDPGFARQIVAVANPLTSEGLMKIALFMRSRSNADPVTALYVRSNDDPESVSMGRQALKTAAAAALAMGVKVEETERYDLNIVAGLTNTMKERNATDVVIGLHRRSNIIDSFFGSMAEGLLRQTKKMIIMSRCFIPVDTVRRVTVVAPRNAEYEVGFGAWLARVCRLGGQIGSRVIFYAYPDTCTHIEAFIVSQEFGVGRDYRQMESWDDFIILSSQIADDDLMIIIGARRGSVSHSSDLDLMPSYLGKHFSSHNLVMLYPEQFEREVGMKN